MCVCVIYESGGSINQGARCHLGALCGTRAPTLAAAALSGAERQLVHCLRSPAELAGKIVSTARAAT